MPSSGSLLSPVRHVVEDWTSAANSINGWLKYFLWTEAAQVIQAYGTPCCRYSLAFMSGHFTWALSLMVLFSGAVLSRPNLRWCLRSSQEHSASPWIERLASSIFLVAALECPEHLQFAGHCWHKLSENCVLLDDKNKMRHSPGLILIWLSRMAGNSELSQISRNLRNISICNECSQVFHQSTCLQKLPKAKNMLRLQEESQPFSRNFSKFS